MPNPIEQPWLLSAEEFAKRARGKPERLYADAKDETAGFTDDILKIEREIDEHVAGLYGLEGKDFGK